MVPIILSLGGSLIVTKDGIQTPFLKKFHAMILRYVRQGRQFVIVCGGGTTCRQYQAAAKVLGVKGKEALDWIGIHSTFLNASLVRQMFGSYATDGIGKNPATRLPFPQILVTCGYVPGHSTDMDTVLLARTHGAQMLINLSNISYVYNKDPRKFPDAKRRSRLSWSELLQITGTHFSSGMHAPFDPVAARTAWRLGLTVKMVNGADLAQVEQAIAGKEFKGTVIG